MPKASRSPRSIDVAADLKKQGRPAKFIYVTPNFQNPAGLLMSAKRRRELLEAARRHDLVILEDDPYGSIYFEDVTTFDDTRPIKADDSDNRVIYLGSFSKILVPGLRVAWMVAPPAIAQKVELCKQAADISSGVLRSAHRPRRPGRRGHRSHRAGAAIALPGEAHRHGARARDAPRRHASNGRRRAAASSSGSRCPGVDDRELFDRAIKEKVSFVLGSAFFVDGGGHQFARLAFSGISHEQIEQGIARLAAAINHPQIRHRLRSDPRRPSAGSSEQ